MAGQPNVRRLGLEDVGMVARIDRSEHVEVEYTVRDGQLVERPVSMTDVPTWDPAGTGPHSVAEQVAFCEQVVKGGAAFVGAFENDALLGVTVVDPVFDGPAAWLAFLYVSRPFRRRGVASLLWDAAAVFAADAGASSMYVSAIPTGSAVGFYLSRGCELADPVHPRLHAKEPDDIHLFYPLG